VPRSPGIDPILCQGAVEIARYLGFDCGMPGEADLDAIGSRRRSDQIAEHEAVPKGDRPGCAVDGERRLDVCRKVGDHGEERLGRAVARMPVCEEHRGVVEHRGSERHDFRHSCQPYPPDRRDRLCRRWARDITGHALSETSVRAARETAYRLHGRRASLQSAAVSQDRVILEVQERGSDQRGSRTVRRLRKQGLIPGVLYGNGHSRAIAVGERELRAALTGPGGLHAIVDVVIEGQTTPHHAVLKDLQQHPIRGTVTHIDFHEVRLDRPIQSAVTVYLVGESVGVAAGGVLTQVVRELNVEALPMEIPERIEADVSALDIGGTLRLAELPLIAGVTFLDDAEGTVIANVAAPRSEAELEELLAPTEAEEGEEGEAPAEGEAMVDAEIAGEAGEEPPAAAAGDDSAADE